MLVELALGRHLEPMIGRFQDNLWMTNYESSYFVEAAHLEKLTSRARAARQGVGSL